MLPNVSDPANEYGLPKTNYDADGPIDPETDLDFAEYEALATDTAAMSHTAPRALVKVDVNAGACTVVGYRSVWGDTPAVYPVAAYVNVGQYTVTWLPGGYPDLNPTPARRETRAPNLFGGKTSIRQAVAATTATLCTPNVAAVYVYEASTGAATDAHFLLAVY